MNLTHALRTLCIIGAVAVLSISLALSAQAKPLATITDDFEPLAGSVVGTTEDRVLIDLDATSGIEPGDLFTISKPGKKIVHPETKKVLGRTQSLQAVLEVGQIADGFSYARPLMQKSEIKPGQEVHRFGNMQAVFWDYPGDNEDVYQRLRKALSRLDWASYRQGQDQKPPEPKARDQHPADQLIFILQDDQLQVRGPEFALIETYPVQTGPSSGTGEAATVPSQSPSGHTARRADGQVSYQERFSQLQTVATFDGPTVMADFLNTKQKMLMVSTDGQKIQVQDIGQESSSLAGGQPDYPGRILSVSWWTPKKDHKKYIVATIWSDERIQSAVFSYSEGSLTCVQDRIEKLLSGFDTDGDHKPETLLAQAYDQDEIFGRRIWKGDMATGSLQWSAPDRPLPRQFRVIGSAFADVTGNGSLETICMMNNILFIFENTTAIYKSSAPVGGSHAVLTYDRDTSVQNRISNSVTFEMPPQTWDIDGDGILEIIVPTFQQDLFGSITGDSGANQSRLLVVNHEKNRFEQGTLGGFIDGSIQGFTVEKTKALLVSSKKGGIFKSGGTSSLLSFPLEK
ncbi:MAG: hypothetical protein R6V55_12600 [Desulfovermiculus sp.]